MNDNMYRGGRSALHLYRPLADPPQGVIGDHALVAGIAVIQCPGPVLNVVV